MKHLVPLPGLTLASVLALSLAACTTAPREGGEKLAKEEAYAPIGTFIPRKNGQGLGAAPVTAVDKTQVENARAMQSNGLAGMPAGQ